MLAGQTGSSSSSTARWGARRVRGGARNDRWGFTFDDVLEAGCSQEEVYRKCAKDILESALNGVNGTIMACELSLQWLFYTSKRKGISVQEH